MVEILESGWGPGREECGCSLCDPELYGDPPGIHPGGLPVVGDYPSVWAPPHFAPEHVLLDTCVVQNLNWAVSAPQLDDEDAWAPVDRRYGPELGRELRAVVGLRTGVEAMLDEPDLACPFVVTRASWREVCCATGQRGTALRAEWRLWRARAQLFDFELETIPHPRFTAMPEQLGWPEPGQLQLDRLADDFGEAAPLGPFRDAGDRVLILEALREEVPAILTTDLKTFWRHRRWLYAHGVEVWRPSDLCWAYWNDANRSRGHAVMPTWPSAAQRRSGR